jgi:hypothetical protein
MEKGILSRSLLLQVARQANEKKMAELVSRILRGGLTRDVARQERRDEKQTGPRPQPFIFSYKPENESFHLRMQFRKSSVSRLELLQTLRSILTELEQAGDDQSFSAA